MKHSSKNQHEVASNPSVSQYLEDKSPSIQSKNVIANVNANKEEEDSFLVFKPAKKKSEAKEK